MGGALDITRYRHSIIAAVGFIVFAGLVALGSLPVSLFPNSTKPAVRMIVLHDFDTQEFKNEVGKKIEDSLRNLEKVERIEVTYQLNRAAYLIYFDWNKDPNEAINDVTAVGSFYRNELPDYLPPMRIAYLDAGIENYVVVTSDRYGGKALSKQLRERLGPALNQIEGILHYIISGIDDDEIRVQVDPLALIQHRVSLAEVVAAVEAARFDVNLGNIRNQASATDNHVFLINKFRSADELKDLIVQERGTRLVRLADVAKVELRVGEQERGFYIGDGPAVAVAAWPKPETNLYQFSHDFRAALETHTAGIGKVISLNDPLSYIDESLSKVLLAVVLGMVFSALAVLFAFRSARLTLMVSSIVPLSLVGSVAVLSALGVGLNIVSLAAMSVAIGLVVDNAVVMIDVLVSRIKERPPQSLTEFRAAIAASVNEAKAPIVAASVTTIVVFLPLAFTLPIVYSLVGELAIVVVCILSLSIFIALLFLPAAILTLCLMFGSWTWLIDTRQETLRRLYERMTVRLLRSRLAKAALLVALSGLVVYSSYLIVYRIEREIVADPQPTIVDVGVVFTSENYSLAARERLVAPIRRQIEERYGDLIRHIFTDMQATVAYVSVHLKDYRDADTLMVRLRREIEETKDFSIEVSPWVSAKLSVPEIPDFRIFAVGESDVAKRGGHLALSEALRGLESVYRLNVFPKAGQHRQLNIDINRSALSSMSSESTFAAARRQLLQYIRYASEERFLYSVKLADVEVPLKLQLTDHRVQTAHELGEIPVRQDGHILNLRHLLVIEQSEDWSQYHTRNGEDAFLVEVWLNEPNDPAARAEITDLVAELERGYKGSYVTFGTGEEIDANIESLVVALVASLLLVVITLLLLNRSLAYSAIILTSIPLGFMGAGFALFLFSSTVSVNSLVGLMLLTGLTINNVILMSDRHRRLLLSNPELDDDEAIARACGSRVRATTVTSFTTILSLLPLALGLGSNGAIMQPLGISVASGLLLSLLCCLLLTPVLIRMALPAVKRAVEQDHAAAELVIGRPVAPETSG